ncbi:metallo-peptidase Clan MH Family M20 [Perkinsela sp. CCAP 1560/4]|nr:metallo-peptidase Clan MH Family M20 [Perkinsela sp. CCAP 1560/4]|eukprot:KNH07718.1 metallo-peptidase Clan MH Family M20 [Perkinsela sp. CCAP 1560/4]
MCVNISAFPCFPISHNRMPTESPAVQTMEPPHSWEIHVMKQQFILRSQLHHIPEKFIDLDIRPDGLSLSTTRFTRKYHLEIPFPKTITIGSVKDVETLLDRRGILTVRVPLRRISRRLVKEREAEIQSRKTAEGQTEAVKTRTKDIFFGAVGKSAEPTAEPSAAQEASKTQKQTKKRVHEKTAPLTDTEMVSISQDCSTKAAKKVAEREKKLQELQQHQTKMVHSRQERQKRKSESMLKAFNKVLQEKKANLQRILGQSKEASTKKVQFSE